MHYPESPKVTAHRCQPRFELRCSVSATTLIRQFQISIVTDQLLQVLFGAEFYSSFSLTPVGTFQFLIIISAQQNHSFTTCNGKFG